MGKLEIRSQKKAVVRRMCGRLVNQQPSDAGIGASVGKYGIAVGIDCGPSQVRIQATLQVPRAIPQVAGGNRDLWAYLLLHTGAALERARIPEVGSDANHQRSRRCQTRWGSGQ